MTEGYGMTMRDDATTGTATGDAAGTTATGDGARIRVAVVDDHEMFRAGVTATLRTEFDIVGQGADVDGSIAMIARTKPDVVLLDVHVPGGAGGGGAEILLKSKAYSPASAFLALSVSDAPQDVGAVIRAGARGYVTKTITGADLISSIKQVHEGYAVFSPKLAGFVLSAFQGAAGADAVGAGFGAGLGMAGTGGANRYPSHDEELDRLSRREQDVMRLIARGYTYKEVAAELFISVKTVETHMSAVLRKLQLSNRTELTRWAADRRIV
nr:response regulator transcription factor [Bifidobacterium stellenboschense]